MWAFVALAIYLMIQGMVWMIKLSFIAAYWIAIAGFKIMVWTWAGLVVLAMGTVAYVQGRQQPRNRPV